mmetsp:Transcript_11303/g.17486  ORF Transcript_11303/g.17486 Transcript_11303/m.17486 type:complete len:309 (+) Transcript_11303:97-1023(+)
MLKEGICVLLLVAILQGGAESLAFTGGSILPQSRPTNYAVLKQMTPCRSELRMSGASSPDDRQLSRRSVLFTAPAIATLASSVMTTPVAQANEGGAKKVVVLGGSGWVGAHVDQLLLDEGYDVLSVARSPPSVQADKVKAILGKSLPAVEYRSVDASKDDLSGVLNGASAVISCVGALPGSSNQRAGNGAVNVRIAGAAKDAGVPTFVYISVASELANSPAKFILGEYFKGKAEAESAIQKDFGGEASLIIKPAIVEGGPPGEIRPPGPPGMTAVPVIELAKVAVAGANGNLKGTVDGYKAIISAAGA